MTATPSPSSEFFAAPAATFNRGAWVEVVTSHDRPHVRLTSADAFEAFAEEWASPDHGGEGMDAYFEQASPRELLAAAQEWDDDEAVAQAQAIADRYGADTMLYRARWTAGWEVWRPESVPCLRAAWDYLVYGRRFEIRLYTPDEEGE